MFPDPRSVRENVALVSWLNYQAEEDRGSPWSIDEWELHTHPDLVERLQELAPSGSRMMPMYGVATLAHPGGIIFAFATGSLNVRKLVAVPPGVRTTVSHSRLDGWIAVEPWPVDIELKQGTVTMTRFMNDLYSAVHALA